MNKIFDLNLEPFKRSQVDQYQGFCFDFDGTIVDSMPSHNKAWKMALQNIGGQISDNELFVMAGIPNIQTAEILIQKLNLNARAHEIVDAKENYFESLREEIKPIQSVIEIIKYIGQTKPLSIVSGNSTNQIKSTLAQFQLLNYFKTIVSSDSPVEGKPSAEPYKFAAHQMGIKPCEVLAFEDGYAGIQSVRAAQIDLIVVHKGRLWASKKI